MARKIIAIVIVVFLIAGIASSFVFGEEENKNIESQFIVKDEETCKEFAKLYIEGNSFDELYKMYDIVKAMRMPKTYFSNQLKKMEHLTGKFESFGKYQLIKNETSDNHILYLNMEHKQVIMMLTMSAPYRDRSDKKIYSVIHNLQFAIVDSDSSTYSLISKIAPIEESVELEYTEKDIKIGKAPIQLDAKITYPITFSASGYPAVVLVQGEGPFDLDYTFDNTAIFKDISQYLAKNGIISIRYNKREFQYSDIGDSKDITPQETVIADTVEAYNSVLNASDINIDKDKIYILAHGYSTYYIPSVLKQIDGKVEGLIYLSGSSLSMLNIKNIQTANKFSELSGEELLEAITENLEDFEKTNKIAELSEDEAKNIKIYDKYAYYYYSQRNYNNDELYSQKNLPMLILQGAEDEEIPVSYGIELWDEKFYGNDKVIRKLYSDIDHMLVKDDGDIMSEDVLNDIVAWIKQDKGE